MKHQAYVSFLFAGPVPVVLRVLVWPLQIVLKAGQEGGSSGEETEQEPPHKERHPKGMY